VTASVEIVSIVTPLGVRFRDEATRSFVSDALTTSVHPVGCRETRRYGVTNGGDVYVFSNLPGLREIEFGEGDDAFWTLHNREFPFELAVRDERGRFLPYSLRTRVPQRSLVNLVLSSPLASPLELTTGDTDGCLPLFSAPGRTVPDGMGAFRAELVELGGGPAAWALVEAKAGNQRLMTGVADQLGRVLVPLLYPKPVVTLGSPGTVNPPLTQQKWRVDVTIRYRRRDPVPDVPDLAEILMQPIAEVYLDPSPLTAWTGDTLTFGRELAIPKLLINPL